MSLSIDFDPEARSATAILRLEGRADRHDAPELRTAVFDAVAVAGGKNLVVDLERVGSIDTAALAVLVEALMETRDGDVDLYLMHPSEAVRKVFRLAGLEEALTRCYDCWDDLATAIAV